jgi:hypothetical protein
LSMFIRLRRFDRNELMHESCAGRRLSTAGRVNLSIGVHQTHTSAPGYEDLLETRDWGITNSVAYKIRLIPRFACPCRSCFQSPMVHAAVVWNSMFFFFKKVQISPRILLNQQLQLP